MKYLFATLMFMILIGLSCASAADTNLTTDVVAENTDLVSDEVLMEDNDDFKTLNDKIVNETSNTFKLDKNYTFNPDNDLDYAKGIKITKDHFTVDGQGHAIDAKNQSRIFQIEGVNATLKNIKFINGNAHTTNFNKYGGAVYAQGSVNIINCTFINNIADYGGAVYISEGKIIDSTFIQNNATTEDGTAIYVGTMCKVYLSNNTVNTEKPEIYIAYSGNISSQVTVTIMNNESVNKHLNEKILVYAQFCDDMGNLIQVSDFDLYVNDTKIDYIYNNQTAKYEGNFTTDKVGKYIIKVNDTYLSNLTVQSGEINIVDVSDDFYSLQNIINNCTDNTLTLTRNYTFNPSTDGDYKEGIEINKNITIDGAGFTVNGLNLARIFNILNFDVNIKNINLINGNASYGGAINAFANSLSLENVNFTNNYAFEESKYGGAINFVGDKLIVSSSKFIDNTASGYQSDGGAILFDGNDLTVIDCEFFNNFAYSSGAIYSDAVNTLISGSVFEQNIAMSEVAAIILYSTKSIINNTKFINNTALDFSIVLNAEGNLTIDNSCFINNTAESSCVRLSMYTVAWINNSVFKNNDVDGQSIDINYATLYLHNNIINNASSEIFNYGGKILSPCTATVETTTTYTIGDKAVIAAVIMDDNGNLIEDAYFVYINVDGNPIESTFNKNSSRYEVEYNFNRLGSVNVNVSAPNENITSNIGANITVVKHTATIAANDASYIINYAGKYSVTIKDLNGSLVAGEKVTFTLNGKNIGSATTNDKGVATITLTSSVLKTAKSGKKNLVITIGSDKYNTASKTVKITVNKEKTKITAKKKTFKRSLKTKKYTMTLKNSKGKAIKKAKVTLKIKGKTYTAKTNSKGKAVFKIKKLIKKGTFKATIKYNGNAVYKAVSKKVNIKLK